MVTAVFRDWGILSPAGFVDWLDSSGQDRGRVRDYLRHTVQGWVITKAVATDFAASDLEIACFYSCFCS